ncbi:MAG: hypothetical protein JRJ84_19720 [Deltaproteobacteria bacterium]|nr:hypothetical protein [Deltaproteobacteria bacterium]
MSPRLARTVQVVLVAVFLFDVALSATTFAVPELWFQAFHGNPHASEQHAFLHRCSANWAAFALIQGVALLRWRQAPWWLAVVAGVRFSDLFTDWTYLLASPEVTPVGWMCLSLPGLGNLAIGLLMLHGYRRAMGVGAELTPSRI